VTEHASLHELAHRPVLDGIERDRTHVAGAVEHGDRNRLAVIGKGRGGNENHA
jgi:hypothetical protein